LSRWRSKSSFISSRESPTGGPEGLNVQAHSEQAQPSNCADFTQIIVFITAPWTESSSVDLEISSQLAVAALELARAISPAFYSAPYPDG
jgi:hypothetical protein